MNQAFNFIGIARGRCAIEYRRKDLDAILPKYTTFLYRDQMVGLPHTLETKPFGAVSQVFAVHLGFGVYGKEADGTWSLLASCIDSSD